MKIHLLSPTELEIRYRDAEETLNRFLTDKARLAGILLAAAGAAALATFASTLVENGQVFLNRGGIRFLRVLRHGMPWVLLVSLLLLWFPAARRRALLYGAMLLVWATVTENVFKSLQGTWLYYVCLGMVPFQGIAGWAYLRSVRSTARKLGPTILFTLAFWAPLAILVHSFAQGRPQLFSSLAWLKLEFVWLSCVIFAYRAKTTPPEIEIALNPLNAARGVLWPYDLRSGTDGEKRGLWWAGMWNIYLAYGIFLFQIWAAPSALRMADSFEKMSGLRLMMILSEVAGYNIVAGMARILGYRVRDATNFVLFSRTPAEYWQRLNVYNYLFILNYVNLPLYRLLRNALVSAFIAYLVFFVNHFWITISMGVLFPAQDKRPEVYSVLLFLGWFAIMYGSRRKWLFSIRSRATALGGWASIIATHFAFFGVNYGATRLYQWLLLHKII